MADNNEKTIKEVFEELDVLVERLEDRETSLEDSLSGRHGAFEILQRKAGYGGEKDAADK